MNGVDVCFCADVHVGNPRAFGGPMVSGINARGRHVLAALRAAVADAVACSSDALVVLGDLFDSSRATPQLVAAVMEVLTTAAENGVPVHLLLGNHDQESTDAGDNALAPLAIMEGVIVHEEPRVVALRKSVELWMVPFQVGRASAWLPGVLESLAAGGKAGTSIALALHLGVIDGATLPFLRESPDAIDLGLLARLCARYGISHVMAGNWHDRRVWNVDVTILGEGAEDRDVLVVAGQRQAGVRAVSLDIYSGAVRAHSGVGSGERPGSTGAATGSPVQGSELREPRAPGGRDATGEPHSRGKLRGGQCAQDALPAGAPAGRWQSLHAEGGLADVPHVSAGAGARSTHTVKVVQVGALAPTGFNNPGFDGYGMAEHWRGDASEGRVVAEGPRFATVRTRAEWDAVIRRVKGLPEPAGPVTWDDVADPHAPTPPEAPGPRSGALPPTFVRWVVTGGREAHAEAAALAREETELGALAGAEVLPDVHAVEEAAHTAAAAARAVPTLRQAVVEYVGAMGLEPDRAEMVRGLSLGYLRAGESHA